MMGWLLVAAVYAVVVVWPLKLAANWLDAERTEWLPCFVAALAAGALGGGLSGLLEGGLTWALYSRGLGLVSLATAALVSGVINRYVLGTTFIRGVLITVIGAIAVPAALLGGVWLVTGLRG